MYCRYFSVAIASVIVVEFCEIELLLIGRCPPGLEHTAT